MIINLKTVLIVFSPCLVFLTLTIMASSAYRDTYESEVQREIYQMERESDGREPTQYEKKRKEYLEKRLKTIKTVGVVEIILSSKIKNGEPVNSLSSASYKQGKIFLFIRVENMRGKYLTHKWYQEGKLKFKKRMKIRGSTYRSWSWVTLKKKKVGNWEGIIYDENDNILARKKFRVTN